MEKNLKKLTILHSNDLHGDFMAEKLDHGLTGGLSMLSGYVNQVRHDEKNVIYAIAGDMFRGSLIDSEYKGTSTIELMNMLAPDVATLGNHEVDYGLAHLLFLEKCARFPIVNANMYIKMNQVRLFNSHHIIEVDGMKVLFIGVLTQEVLAATKQEALIGTMVDVRDAVGEVGVICDSYRSVDIDFTVLLTHIGIDADRELAALLDPDWGVDLIIGGHSHTFLEQPEIVNGIPIVQAACGTDQIGRFDIMVDTDANVIDSYEWQLIPIDETHCPRDLGLEDVLARYKEQTDAKYGRYITRFKDQFTHPLRERETQIGRLFADILRESSGLDVVMVGSGSLRCTAMGPIVTYGDLIEMYPYDDEIICVTLTGAQFKHALNTIFRPESLENDAHAEFYQYSHGVQFVVDRATMRVLDVCLDGAPLEDDRVITLGVQSFHFANLEDFMGLSYAEASAICKPRPIIKGSLGVLEEWMLQHELVEAPSDERWVTLEDKKKRS